MLNLEAETVKIPCWVGEVRLTNTSVYDNLIQLVKYGTM